MPSKLLRHVRQLRWPHLRRRRRTRTRTRRCRRRRKRHGARARQSWNITRALWPPWRPSWLPRAAAVALQAGHVASLAARLEAMEGSPAATVAGDAARRPHAPHRQDKEANDEKDVHGRDDEESDDDGEGVPGARVPAVRARSLQFRGVREANRTELSTDRVVTPELFVSGDVHVFGNIYYQVRLVRPYILC